MKRTMTFVAAAVVVVVGLVLGQAALADGSGTRTAGMTWHGRSGTTPRSVEPAAAPPIDREIVVTQRFGDELAIVDLGDPGFTPGDYLVVRDPLYNAANTTRVGTLVVQCTLTFGVTNLCEGTGTLRNRGKISFFGTDVVTSAVTDFPLTGGQGEFRAIRGEARVEFGQTSNRITLRIVD